MKWYKFDIRNLTKEEYDFYFSLMSIEKQQRVSRFRHYSDKLRSVSGEMLARKAISEWCNIDNSEIVFSKSKYGKPFVQDMNVEFSVSHSGDFAVCAVDAFPIGIDIEKIRMVNTETIRKACTPEEADYILKNHTENHTPAEDELIRFFEIWTAKEAYFKQLGCGIYIPDKCDLNYDSITHFKFDGYVGAICC